MTTTQLMLDGSDDTQSAQKLLEQQAATIYKVYPRKVGPKRAKMLIVQVLNKKTISYKDLLAAVKRYAVEVEGKLRSRELEKKYVPHPTTWIQRESWLDEPDPPIRRQRIQPPAGKYDC